MKAVERSASLLPSFASVWRFALPVVVTATLCLVVFYHVYYAEVVNVATPVCPVCQQALTEPPPVFVEPCKDAPHTEAAIVAPVPAAEETEPVLNASRTLRTYTFDAEPQQNQIKDVSGNGVDAVNVGAVWLESSGSRAGVMQFNKEGSRIDLPGFSVDAGVISFWFKTEMEMPAEHDHDACLMDFRSPLPKTGPIITISKAGAVGLQIGWGRNNMVVNQYSKDNGFNDNKWHHLEFVFFNGRGRRTAGKVELLIDGNKQIEQKASSWELDPARQIYLGRSADPWWTPLEGFLDDFNVTETPPPPLNVRPRPKRPDGSPAMPQVELFIGISTAFQNADLRLAVRETWLRYHSLWDGKIVHRFFVGQTANTELLATVQAENDKYKDIVFLPFMDTYNNLSLKTMHLSKWATDHYDFTYLLKMDDDTFLRLDRYVARLQNKPIEMFYYGLAEPGWQPHRKGKWAVSYEDWPDGKEGPPWQHGFIYTMSFDCATWLGDALPKPRLHLEDVNTGIILSDHGVAAPYMGGILGSGCSEDMTASHYVPGSTMREWYRNSLTGRTMCSNTPYSDT
eukprot:TRINITY_DN4786_c0_g1_i1.p1 TRINITY_DN4786_c0_g1~~TRINITY_DN4786_c0_g1_i1.p1  ORF type:complete len:568 (+),score=229.93 TRINITY_DN4786_c0_g1_i1:167-1870(+)